MKKSESKSTVAGDYVLIECRASGDPHPNIVWTKSERDIDISKAKIIHGKGLGDVNVSFGLGPCNVRVGSPLARHSFKTLYFKYFGFNVFLLIFQTLHSL